MNTQTMTPTSQPYPAFLIPSPAQEPARRGPTAPPERDLELMRRITGGDHEAFAELFARHSAAVLRLLRGMVHSRHSAEEIVQEAFLQLWQQADRYRPERATPRGWLMLLARSRALDRIRAHRARRRREETAHREHFQAVQWQPEGPAQLESAERRRQVGSALAGLSEVQRTCVELAFFEDLSHSQIARRLDQPLGTVKSRILLGMKKMRLALAS